MCRRSFETEQRTVFRGHDTRLHPAPRPIRSDRSVTTDLLRDDPTARFEATTSTHVLVLVVAYEFCIRVEYCNVQCAYMCSYEYIGVL